MSGVDESRVTFLAARRWFGWSSGRLLVIDIGGGSLELASGIDEDPDVAISLPLGAGRLPGTPTRRPPTAQESRAVRSYIRATVARQVRPLLKAPTPDRVVGTSKTMRSLARIAGAAPRDSGPFVPRELRRADLETIVDKLKGLDARGAGVASRGVLGPRPPDARRCTRRRGGDGPAQRRPARHLPWALREGLILRRLDLLALTTSRTGLPRTGEDLARTCPGPRRIRRPRQVCPSHGPRPASVRAVPPE